MASEKQKIYCLFSLFLIITNVRTVTATNVNCNGKPFHCVNSTHFMICVDFGGGVSTTVDDFVIQCPPTTVCRANNRFECEYQIPTTADLMIQKGDETTHFEYDAKTTSTWNNLTTEIPPFQLTTEILGEYSNTVSATTQANTPIETQTQNSDAITDIPVISPQVEDTFSTSDLSLNYSDILTYEASDVEIFTSPPSIKHSLNNDSLNLKISSNEGLIEDTVYTISTLSSTVNNNIPTIAGTLELTATIGPITEANDLIKSIFSSENIIPNTTERKRDAVVKVTDKKYNDNTTPVNFNDVLSTLKDDDTILDNNKSATESHLLSAVTVQDIVTEAEVIHKVTSDATEVLRRGFEQTTTVLLQDQRNTESTSFDKSYVDFVTIYDSNFMKAVTDHIDQMDVVTKAEVIKKGTTETIETLRGGIEETTTAFFQDERYTESTSFNNSYVDSVTINDLNLTEVVTDHIDKMDIVTEAEVNKKVTTETTETLRRGIQETTTAFIQDQRNTESTSFDNLHADSVTIYDLNLTEAVIVHTDKIDIVNEVDISKNVTTETTETTTALIQDQRNSENTSFDNSYIHPVTIYDLNVTEAVTDDTDKLNWFRTESTLMPAHTVIDTDTLKDRTTSEITLSNDFHTTKTTEFNRSADSTFFSGVMKPTDVPDLVTKGVEVTRIEDVKTTVQIVTEGISRTTITNNMESSLYLESVAGGNLLDDKYILNIDNSDISIPSTTITDLYVTELRKDQVATSKVQEAIREEIGTTFTESWQYQTYFKTSIPSDYYPFSTGTDIKEESKTDISIKEEYSTSLDITTKGPGTESTTLVENTDKVITDIPIPRSTIKVDLDHYSQDQTTTNTILVENSHLPNNEKSITNEMYTQSISTAENVPERELFTTTTNSLPKSITEPRSTENNVLLSTNKYVTTEMSTESKLSTNILNTSESVVKPIPNNVYYLNVTKAFTEITENVTVTSVTQEHITGTPFTSTGNIYQGTDQTTMIIDLKSKTDSFEVGSNIADVNLITTVNETNQKVELERKSLIAKINESLDTAQIFSNTENTFSLQYLETADVSRSDDVLEGDKMLFKEKQNIGVNKEFRDNNALYTTDTSWGTTEQLATPIRLNDIEIFNNTLEVNETHLPDQSISRNIDVEKYEISLNSSQFTENLLPTEQPLVTVTMQESLYSTRFDSLVGITSNIVSENRANRIDVNTTVNKNDSANEWVRTTPDSINQVIALENQNITQNNSSRDINHLTELYDANIDSSIIHNGFKDSLKELIPGIPANVFQEQIITEGSKNVIVVNESKDSITTQPTIIYSEQKKLHDVAIKESYYKVFNTTVTEEADSTYAMKFKQGYDNIEQGKTIANDQDSDVFEFIKSKLEVDKTIDKPLMENITVRSSIDNDQLKFSLESLHSTGPKSIVPAKFAEDTIVTIDNISGDFKTIGSIDRGYKTDSKNVVVNDKYYTPTAFSNALSSQDVKLSNNSSNKTESQDTLKLNYTNNNLYTQTIKGLNHTNLEKSNMMLLQQSEVSVYPIRKAATTPLDKIMDDKLVSRATETIPHIQNVSSNNAKHIVEAQTIAIKQVTLNDALKHPYNEHATTFLNKIDDALREDLNVKRSISESKIRNKTYIDNTLSKGYNNSELTINVTDNRTGIMFKSYTDYNIDLASSAPQSIDKTLVSYNDNLVTTQSPFGIEDAGNIYVLSESGLVNNTKHQLKSIQNQPVKLNSSSLQKSDGMQHSGLDNVNTKVAINFIPNTTPSSITNDHYDLISQLPSRTVPASFKNYSQFSEINCSKVISNDTKYIQKNNTKQVRDQNSTTLNIFDSNNRIEEKLKDNITHQFNLKIRNVTTLLRAIGHSTKKAPAHPLLFTCQNRLRGRYADRSDCAKFYICIGRMQPLLGKCPVNTVFSEIKKQCTKNLSHCIRNNQFHCLKEGRFSDPLRNNIYYICVRNNNIYLRFQFQCQSGYYLNKTSIRCAKELTNQVSTTSNDSDSNRPSAQSTVEHSSKEKKDSTAKAENLVCRQEGKFPYKDNCRKYYVCSKNSKSVFRRKLKKCDSDEVYHKEKKKCVSDDSYECD